MEDETILPTEVEVPYYPCNDPLQQVCKQFVNRGKCRRNLKCRFYHPPIITEIIKKKARRQSGHCHCGALQKRIVNKRAYTIDENGRVPTFFVICSRTGRSMRLCL